MVASAEMALLSHNGRSNIADWEGQSLVHHPSLQCKVSQIIVSKTSIFKTYKNL